MNAESLGLRQAALVLDPEWIRARLERTELVSGAARVEPTYLRAKPGTSLLVLYRVTFPELISVGEDGDAPRVTWLHALAGDGSLVARERAKWLALHPSLGAVRDFVALDDEHDLVLARFPYDLGLRRLPAISVARRMKRLHEDLGFPLGRDEQREVRARGSHAEVLSYRPRRRCVVRWDVRTRAGGQTERRRAVVRLLDHAVPHGARWREQEPAFHGVPQLLAHDGYSLLLEEDLGGRTPGHAELAEQLDAVGDLVGRFHRWSRGQAVEAFATAAAFSQRMNEQVEVALSGLHPLAPELAADAAALAEKWRSDPLPDHPGRWTGIHGDLHGLQFVQREAGSLGLVDLDRAEPGPAEADLGNLLADLAAHGVEPARARQDLLPAWTRAFGEPPDDRLLERYTACALLRAAADPLRRFEPDAVAKARLRLRSADELLS